MHELAAPIPRDRCQEHNVVTLHPCLCLQCCLVRPHAVVDGSGTVKLRFLGKVVIDVTES